MTKATKKLPVSRRALIQRINRALAKDGKELRASRGAKAVESFGHYYVASGRKGHEYIFARNIDDLEAWARENVSGVLRDYETMVDE